MERNQYSVVDVYRSLHGSRYKTKRRRMFIHKCYCANSELGAVFFALEGTPSQGYGIFSIRVFDEGTLSLYNGHGQRFKIIKNCTITDLDNFEDNDILKVGLPG